jgi:hypothetical protein
MYTEIENVHIENIFQGNNVRFKREEIQGEKMLIVILYDSRVLHLDNIMKCMRAKVVFAQCCVCLSEIYK